MEEGIVLLKGEEEERFIPVKNFSKRMVLLTINYTNAKIAGWLKEEGVPLIEHFTLEESKMRSLREKAYHSFRFGGNATKVYPSHHGFLILEGTGRPIFQAQGIRVKADAAVNALLGAFRERKWFMRTRKVFTDMGIQRGRKLMKYKTMLFSAIPERAAFSKRNTLEVTDSLPATYRQLINVCFWLGGIFDNSDIITIELTGRQPGAAPTHQLLFKTK